MRPAWPSLLSLLDERERSEVDVPPRGGIRLGAAPGLSGVQRCARRVFFQRLDEPIRTAVRREADERLVGLAFSEVAHAPRVGGIQLARAACR